MIQLTESDRETLALLAGTLEQQNANLHELIQHLHTVRAHLIGADGIIKNVLRRAEERRAPDSESDPGTRPRTLRRPDSER